MTKVLLLVVTGLALVLGSTRCAALETLQMYGVGAVDITDTSAVIRWCHEENNRRGTVEYGLTEEYGTTANESQAAQQIIREVIPGEAKLLWEHKVQVMDLLPATTYYFRIKGTESRGSFTTDPSPEFEITSYEVTNSGYGARVRVQFESNVDGVEVKLLDPSRSMVSEPRTTLPSDHEVAFGIHTRNAPPVSGVWTLVANYEGTEIDRFTFEHAFAGTIVTITKVTLYWEGGPSSFTLARVSVDATNTGDMPADLDAPAEVHVGSRLALVEPWSVSFIEAGEDETVILDADITGVPAGQTTFKVILKGPNGEVVSTYTSTVTPS